MRAGGFSLLELLVVLALAALLLNLAPPLVSTALPGTELEAAARELAAGLRMARSLAVTRQREASLHLDLERRTFRVAGSPRVHAIPHRLRLRLITAESELEGARQAGIRFFPDGGSTGGRITLDNGRRTLGVDVDWLTGRVRILAPERGG